MKRMIAVKIDTAKIDKSRLFVGRNGAKYLDVILIETPDSQYGDWMAVQGVSKEERAAGGRGAIIGNGKNLSGGVAAKPEPAGAARDLQPEDDGSVPF